MKFLTVTSVIYVFTYITSMVKGQCSSIVSNLTITSCNGEAQSGSIVYIDFHQINQPCSCTVIPSFLGNLLVSVNPVPFQCNTLIEVGEYRFNCPLNVQSSTLISVNISQLVSIYAVYASESTPMRFYQCVGVQEKTDGGTRDNITVICGTSPFTSHTSSRTTSKYSSTTVTKNYDNASSETTVIPTKYTQSGSTRSSLFVHPPEKSEINYVIIGSASGGGLVLIAVIIILIVIFSRKENKQKHSSNNKHNTEHKNETFEYEHKLPDNPLYHSNQPVDDVGYSTADEQRLGPPPSQLTANIQKANAYDTPVTLKSKNDVKDIPEIPVYAIPKKSNVSSTEVSTGAVYAQVSKPQKNPIQTSVRDQNQDGLLYMEVEHSHPTSSQNWPYTIDNNSENVEYAEIKKS
ncbi:uncharacterized protein LOC134252312 [Saccostrea cucullata]|uniref:uncharacterized protein LOC134252312 n=1 Tax=Saccostrea cuccullata TaxID=36930 RepID=UPI002ED27134